MVALLLCRHGRTAWNRERRMQGWAPVGLDDRGHEQARAVGRYLASEYDVDRLVGSDLRRTRETAAHVAEATGCSPTLSAAWRERDLGVYQGLRFDHIADEFDEYLVEASGPDAARATPESGESTLDVRERVLAAFDALADDLAGETACVVAHGGPIRLVLGAVKGLDVVASYREQPQDNGCLNELRVEGDDRRVVRENATPWT